jgi:hypothetical protein
VFAHAEFWPESRRVVLSNHCHTVTVLFSSSFEEFLLVIASLGWFNQRWKRFQVVYRCPKVPTGEQVGVGKRGYKIVISPLEFIARVAALIPPPRQHPLKRAYLDLTDSFDFLRQNK